jgi:predicted ArsR family transcriptional regulator
MEHDERDELDDRDPEEAEAAIDELVATSRVDELAEFARARHDRVAFRAIDGLGDVGSAEAAAALVELLEEVRVPRVFWGTEQKREHERRQNRVVQSLARARGVPAPAGRSHEDIEAFIEECRGR